jgi:TfoX/Sxy family transcriptional regulator of competence genes
MLTCVAYDEGLATRVRELLANRPGVAERKMFGGVGFTIDGNIAVGIRDEDLIVRLPPDESEAAAAADHVRPMTMKGRGSIRGWLLVGPEATTEENALARWVERAAGYASSLPRK